MSRVDESVDKEKKRGAREEQDKTAVLHVGDICVYHYWDEACTSSGELSPKPQGSFIIDKLMGN